MPKYNPNSIWGERQKKDPSYTQPTMKPAAKKEVSPAVSVAAKGAPEVSAKPKEEARFFKKTPIEQFDYGPRRNHTLRWMIAGGVAIVALLVGYIFFLMPPAGPNVGIEFPNAGRILVGDQFTFSVSLSNYSQNVLKNALLSVFLPDNVSAIDSPGQRVIEKAVGDLGPGGINPQDFKLIVTGDPQSTKHVLVKLTYSTDATSKTQFETDGGVDLVIGGPALSLNFDTPASVVSGQDFDTTIRYNNNTSHSFQGVELVMQYPPVYSFTRSTMEPEDVGNRTWDLGTIPAGGSGTLTLTGNIVGPGGATYALGGNFTGKIQGTTYTLTSQTASVAVGASPLSLAIALNGDSDYVAHAGDALTYTLTYTNTSNVTFQNVAIKAALIGSMFDFSSLQSKGSFSSLTNTVTWNAANVPQLLNLAPGQSGSVELSVKTKSSFPIRLLSDKNYSLKINAQISSPTVGPGMVASSTVSVANAEHKVGGAIALTAKGYWRDAPSGILNGGPYPPKVDRATQYTIHWALTNYSTDAQNVVVSASLQSGTTCTGTIKSNIASAPTCDPGSGMITWTIPTLPATTGIAAPLAEAIIQVTNTPAVNQVNQAVTLVGQATLQGTDAFTGKPLTASAPAVTTNIPDDKTIPSSQSRMVTQ